MHDAIATDTDTDWDAAAALLPAMTARALEHDQVLTQALAGGAELLVYPIAGQAQALIGVGLPAARAQRLEVGVLLRRRGARMTRLGDWMPARFEDGSLFLLRRWPAPAAPAWSGGAAQALRHAWEALDE